MEYEVTIKDGAEKRFEITLIAFDANAKIISKSSNFVIETKTEWAEIKSWTMVVSVVTRNSIAFGSGANLGGWSGYTQHGSAFKGNTIINSSANGAQNQTVITNPWVTSSSNQKIISSIMSHSQQMDFISLLSNCKMCSDNTRISVENMQTGIIRSLLKLNSTPNEITVTVPNTNSPCTVTLGDFRSLYNFVLVQSPLLFDDGSGSLLPIKSSKLSSVLGSSFVILEF